MPVRQTAAASRAEADSAVAERRAGGVFASIARKIYGVQTVEKMLWNNNAAPPNEIPIE